MALITHVFLTKKKSKITKHLTNSSKNQLSPLIRSQQKPSAAFFMGKNLSKPKNKFTNWVQLAARFQNQQIQALKIIQKRMQHQAKKWQKLKRSLNFMQLNILKFVFTILTMEINGKKTKILQWCNSPTQRVIQQKEWIY